MADDPNIREIGRIEDERGRILIIGVNYGAVTLQTLQNPQTLRPRTDGPVTLSPGKIEEFARLYAAATWEAAWQAATDSGRPQLKAAGEPPW